MENKGKNKTRKLITLWGITPKGDGNALVDLV
jgi:hypothetical protein